MGLERACVVEGAVERNSPWLWLVVFVQAWCILANHIRNTRRSQRNLIFFSPQIICPMFYLSCSKYDKNLFCEMIYCSFNSFLSSNITCILSSWPQQHFWSIETVNFSLCQPIRLQHCRDVYDCWPIRLQYYCQRCMTVTTWWGGGLRWMTFEKFLISIKSLCCSLQNKVTKIQQKHTHWALHWLCEDTDDSKIKRLLYLYCNSIKPSNYNLYF